MRRILFLAWAEVLHLVRDKATLAQALVIPVVQLLILANAATFSIRDTPLYVVDQDRSTMSRELIAKFTASRHFKLVGQATTAHEADERLLDGTATMVLVVPHDFEKEIVRTGDARVQVVINAEKGSAAGITQSYAGRIITQYARELSATLHPTPVTIHTLSGDAPTPARGAELIDVRTRGWYNAPLDYRHYMVPGILVALVTIIGTLLTAQNVAREKELGTLEQLNVTPITRAQFIAAKLLPFWVLGLIELSLGLAVGWAVFAIPIRGSLILFFGIAALYLVAALGIGLWISTIVDTQQQAMFVSFFIMMIYMLMSGLFTPIDSMPRWVQYLAELNPVKHFVLIARAILMKGAGIPELRRDILALVAYATTVLFVAVRQYSKKTA